MTRNGVHPDDPKDFASAMAPVLREAAAHLRWLADHGYADGAANTLVGDRFQLSKRQRQVLARSTCSSTSAAHRIARRRATLDRPVHLDGFNVLLPVQRALTGGPVFRGQDGAYRDLGGLNGSWRQTADTERAIDAVAAVLAGHQQVTWWLDSPVSNSGRLAGMLRDRGFEVRMERSVDPVIVHAEGLIATSDAWILEHDLLWIDLIGPAIERAVESPWILAFPESP